MDCRTCDHKMNRVTTNTFWCPRCGTIELLLVPVDSDEIVGVPTLVKVGRKIVDADSSRDALRKVNDLVECCYPPDER